MNATASPSFTDVPERIAQLIWVLCQTVTERWSLRVRTLTKEQVEYICGRLLAARTRFRRVVERVRAGKPPKARALKPRARRIRPKREKMSDADMNSGFAPPRGWRRWAREDRARDRAARKAAQALAEANKPVPLWRTLRQHLFGWLCGCAPAIAEYPHSAAGHAIELRGLLADPEMRALLMSNRCVGDSLRTLCWGLGVERSLLYPEPATPEPAAPVPDENFSPGLTIALAPPAVSGVGPSSRGSSAARWGNDLSKPS